MTWRKVVSLAAAAALIAGLSLWAYYFFEAPESIEQVTAKWSESGHADTGSESFVHWDGDEPPLIPENCAGCHSLYGYLDYLGTDTTEVREVNSPALTGTVLYCNVCHNEAGHTLDMVVFPGGAEVSGVGRWANCMRCHQGRTSTETVRQAVEALGPDQVSEELRFINVHYAIGAATRYGSKVRVGYQYQGREYAGWYPHVEEYDNCIECHDAHSTQIEHAACAPCHSGVVTYDDIFEIREGDVDYDGDGDTGEGILREIHTLHAALYEAVQAYAADVIGSPIIYAERFPYWFRDSDADGEVDEDETSFGNQYGRWTPRLVRAAYNYHYAVQDPGGFTHNALYILQLIYDAIENLGEHQQVEAATDKFVRPEAAY
jgi:hypothetical protein